MSALGPDLRRANQRSVVDQLRAATVLSRADLAQRTGLSAPTVGKVADELIEAGFLEEAASPGSAAPGDRGLGRPARPLRLERATRRFVALQLGVKRTRLAALPLAGPVDENWAIHFATPKRPVTWQRRLKQASKRLRFKQPWAVLVSTPGVTDERAGQVLLSPNLPWTEKADLVDLIRSVWNVPILLAQEIRALALGHLSVNAQGEDFLLVDFGTGVGAALVRHGQLYDGALPLAGELGHTAVAGNNRRCGCGAVGCVETLVSRVGLMQSFGRKKTWKQFLLNVERRGVQSRLGKSLDAVAAVIGGAMNITGVNHVVITGSLAEMPIAVMDRLRRSIERSSMWSRFGQVEVLAAPRRRGAGLVAAAMDRLLLPVHPPNAGLAGTQRAMGLGGSHH